MKSNVLIVVVAMLAVLAGVLMQMQNASDQQLAAPSPQLDFSFPDVQGQMHSVSQWRGKILLINFWATWCPPCLKEIPEFIQWQQEYGDKSVQFVGIALDDQDAVVDYLKTVAINYPILIAGEEGSMLARQLGNIINAVPFTVVVDGQGQIIHRQPGELTREQFLELVQPLVGGKT